ncbi:MAG: helix-turn-helix transcriptional regulator [Proteobacteria bacterium]|nr:helix-turn-helix transcriptional regulator [Pseudomonadota bacterium]
MPAQDAPVDQFDLVHLMRMERMAFAAKVRLARAVAGLSQSDLAARVGMTQRSIHKLEQGGTEPRRSTVAAIEMLWREYGIEFEDLGDGGFRAVVRAPAFARPVTTTPRRGRPGRLAGRPHATPAGLRS